MLAVVFVAVPPILNDGEAFVIAYPDPNETLPPSLKIVMAPPVPASVLVPPVKLYVPELALMLMPVLAALVVTLPVKLIVPVWLPEMVTTLAVFAWLMTPPHVTVPVLVPTVLNVEPVAPVSVPAVVPHVPVTALRFTPLVPPVELTLANVPLTAPVVRLRAVWAAETLTEAPMVSVPKFVVLVMPVAGPVIVTPASKRLVLVPWSETPVVPFVIVPPLTVTV